VCVCVCVCEGDVLRVEVKDNPHGTSRQQTVPPAERPSPTRTTGTAHTRVSALHCLAANIWSASPGSNIASLLCPELFSLCEHSMWLLFIWCSFHSTLSSYRLLLPQNITKWLLLQLQHVQVALISLDFGII